MPQPRYPGSPLQYPKLQRGAIIGIDPAEPAPTVVPFQFNPDSLGRTLQAQMGAEGGDRAEALRLKGAPIETVKIDVEIDAADDLERGDETVGRMGIYPQLSALEMLIYPRSRLVIANTLLLSLGTIEILPPTAPLTVFVYGERRALPVKITEFAITEEAHDQNLNPIRAKVSLGLRVLSVDDLGFRHRGGTLFMAYLRNKESLAGRAATVPLSSLGVESIG